MAMTATLMAHQCFYNVQTSLHPLRLAMTGPVRHWAAGPRPQRCGSGPPLCGTMAASRPPPRAREHFEKPGSSSERVINLFVNEQRAQGIGPLRTLAQQGRAAPALFPRRSKCYFRWMTPAVPWLQQRRTKPRSCLSRCYQGPLGAAQPLPGPFLPLAASRGQPRCHPGTWRGGRRTAATRHVTAWARAVGSAQQYLTAKCTQPSLPHYILMVFVY